MRVVDTSAWIEWLRDSELGRKSIRRFLCRRPGSYRRSCNTNWGAGSPDRSPRKPAGSAIAFSNECVVTPLDTTLALRAAEIANAHALAMADSIIMAGHGSAARSSDLRRAFRRAAGRRLFRQERAMSERPRRFFLPLIGFVLLFAAFGPAIGGVLFAPIVIVLAAPYGAEAAGTRRRIRGAVRSWAGAGLRLYRRHRAGGVGGLRLWAVGRGGARGSAARPRRGDHRRRGHLFRLSCGSPRSAHPSRRAWAPTSALNSRRGSIAWFPRGFDVTLRDALVACGAVAGLACAMAANLIGLTTRGALAPAPASPAPSGGG